ncbi:MAG: hypothetical protein HSCHL_2145 [Hydrogenibacillus schlegelii]|uniref:Uncharacterized protein n=1 Tax=Hydrogenibacillus schlegelii TaxID=1484 RepID=A0A2T5GA91_HYDSH|nr:MAG: hypothetical protein HSCHL_2145 [Hydrogenibacillus schlegelii]
MARRAPDGSTGPERPDPFSMPTAWGPGARLFAPPREAGPAMNRCR